MPHGSIYSKAANRSVRSNNRSQLNWFRRSSVREAVEHWDQEIESGRHVDSFKAFESTARRRPQLEGLGQTAWG